MIYSALQSEIEYGTGLMEITREALAQLIVTTGDVEEEYNAFVERWNTKAASSSRRKQRLPGRPSRQTRLSNGKTTCGLGLAPGRRRQGKELRDGPDVEV